MSATAPILRRLRISPSWLACLCLAGLVASVLPQGEIAAQQPAPAAPKPSLTLEERLAWIERRIELLRSGIGVPGLSLAIVKDDRVVLLKGFGERDAAKKLPVTADTLFPIGSISKPMAALLLLMLADEGKLALDDLPSKHLPDFKLRDADANARVTLRDLLAHRSGLERADIGWLAADGALSRKDVIAGLSTLSQVAKPGAEFHYNNYAYVAAGEATARAAALEFETLIESRVFRPLGMSATTGDYKRLHSSADHSLGYLAATYQPPRAKDVDTTVIAPAGGIISSARDMAEWVRFAIEPHHGRWSNVVKAASAREWMKPQVMIGPGSHYALGWFVEEWRGKKIAHHGGNVPGYSALVAVMPEARLGFAVLTNASNSALGSEILMDTVFSGLTDDTLAAPDAAMPPRRDPSAAPVTPLTVAGKYVHPLGDLQVIVLRGQHVMRVPGQLPYMLEPLGENSYRLEGLVGYSATVRPGTHIPSSTELFVKQPQMNLVLPRRDGSSLAPDDVRLKELLGSYRLGNGDPVEIVTIGGKLAIVFPWQPAYPLVPEAKADTYRIHGLKPDGAFTLSPRRSRGASMIGISIRQPNGVFEADRTGIAKADITIDELRLRVVAALGGEAALRAKTTLTGRYEVTAPGLSATVKASFRAPTSSFHEGEMKAVGKSLGALISRFDGESGTIVEPKTPARAMVRDELDWHRIEAAFQEPLLWKDIYASVALKGIAAFNGVECYAVEKTFKGGRSITDYYAVETHFLIGREGQRWNEATKDFLKTRITYSEHRPVDGVVLAHLEVGLVAGIEITQRWADFTWNVPLDDEIFRRKP